MQTITSTNPYNGEDIKTYPLLTDKEVIMKIEQAHDAHMEWASFSFQKRAACLRTMSGLLHDNGRVYAELITQEMGKTITESISEIQKCAKVCDYYAEYGEEQLQNISISTDAHESYIHYKPLGVILAVMPWNFPFWQVFRFLAPSLMAGNAGLLKHASNVPGCAEAIEQIIRAAEFPEGLFYNLHINSSQVHAIIEHENVQAVTLTGSEPAGASVASIAAKAIKKSVLELGGSDPYVVLEDADLENAVSACVRGRMLNAGQSCIAAKRMIVVEEVYDEFVKELTIKIKALVMDDPMNEQTDIGPMAKKGLRDELHEQVEKSIQKGAQCVLGGIIPDRVGAFYPPTLLTNVEPGMEVFDEETFGPVACVIKAKNEEHALELAAMTEFGLGAAVFTEDIERGKRIAESDLFAGSCFVNTFVKSDPRLPFGGIKKSGFGRELSAMGIKEFVNAKTIYVQ